MLPNGLRVLTEPLPHVESVSLGVWLETGLKDEPPGQEGINHFLEHMLFKGTRTRSALDIAEASDDIGGQVNGYTEREAIHLYARTTSEHVSAALELLLDLLLHSRCAPDDVAREREVVLQELRHVQDTPEEWVHDLILEAAWPDHPLGRQLMGRPESVQAMECDALLTHLEAARGPDRVLVTAAGRLSHQQVVDLVGQLTAELPQGPPRAPDHAPVFAPGVMRLARQTGQVHLCMAAPACRRADPEQYAFGLLDTILGGGVSSRLFQEIRENRGLAYNIGSYVHPFRAAGLFVVSAGTAPRDFELVVELIRREVARLREGGVAPQELSRARAQLQTSLALAAESTTFRMQHLAGCMLYWGRVLSFDEIAAGVEAVTAEDIHRLAADLLTPERTALVAIGPF